MKAIVQQQYGTPSDVLRIDNVDAPAAQPGRGEIQVRVRAISLSKGDWHSVTGTPYVVRMGFGIRRPKNPIPGRDIAGVVVAVGSDVSDLAVGDHVYGETGGGGFAEFVNVPAKQMGRMPANLSFEDAAAVPVSGMTALEGLRTGGLQAGQRVLIVGAAGGVGSWAVQIAKARGAHVTAVAGPDKVDAMRSLGADEVIDYSREAYIDGDARYDLILDMVGPYTLRQNRNMLTKGGTYALGAAPGGKWLGPIPRFLKAMLVSGCGRGSLKVFVQTANTADLDELRLLLEAGEIKPVISSRLTMDQIPAALTDLGRGHNLGKAVATIYAGD